MIDERKHILRAWVPMKKSPDYPREETRCITCGQRFQRYQEVNNAS